MCGRLPGVRGGTMSMLIKYARNEHCDAFIHGAVMTTHEATDKARHNADISSTIEADISSTIEQISVTVSKLPECSDAGKLRGIAARLAAAAQDGSESVSPLARRLAAAVDDAVEADPWVALSRLARSLLEICEPRSVDNIQIAASAPVTAGPWIRERRRNPNQEQTRKRRAEQEERWNNHPTESSAADAETHD
jgi:hypothetical protein